MKFKSLSVLAGAAIAATIGFATPQARADLLFQLTSDDCTGGCGPQASFGTILLAQNGANDVKVTVSLLNNNKFIITGAADALDFNLTGNPTITETNFSAGFGAGSIASGQSIHADGTGDFEYSALCTLCGPGGSSPQTGPLVFDVGAAGITPASFIQNGTLNFFAVDIISGTNTKTGAVDASTPGVVVPAPVIGHGLFVLLAVGGVFFGGKLLEGLKKRQLHAA